MNSKFKRIVSFTRKRSNNPSQERKILHELLPQNSVIVPEDGGIVEKLSNICGREYTKYVLEIGFGSGENILERAIEQKDTAFIGCEVFTGGVTKLLKDIEENQVSNIRIWHDDAVELILRLPNNSIDLIYILHPDPWPKQRHKKRRLISFDFLKLISSKLKEKGEIFIITDHKNYASSITKVLSQIEFLVRLNDHYPKITKTKYRLKAEALGDTCEYFYLKKR